MYDTIVDVILSLKGLTVLAKLILVLNKVISSRESAVNNDNC